MEWTNELILMFLDLYEGEPVIWNPRNEYHKDRSYVHDAWIRIQAQMSVECSLKELKWKKENLMSTYRKVVMKVRNSGKGTSQVYKPEWFAYDKMASFLNPVYAARDGPRRILTKVRNTYVHHCLPVCRSTLNCLVTI